MVRSPRTIGHVFNMEERPDSRCSWPSVRRKDGLSDFTKEKKLSKKKFSSFHNVNDIPVLLLTIEEDR